MGWGRDGSHRIQPLLSVIKELAEWPGLGVSGVRWEKDDHPPKSLPSLPPLYTSTPPPPEHGRTPTRLHFYA